MGRTQAAAAATPSMGRWLLLAFVLLVADQLTKYAIASTYVPGETTYVLPFFNLTRVHNTGAAFSFLAGASGWQRWFFTAIGLVATAVILVMLRRNTGQKLLSFALACILGGALGNVIDRVAFGYVVDFLQFHFEFLKFAFPGGYFPSFNIADSAITIGAASLIADELLRMRRSRQGPD